jgi:hypothetical protein
VFRSCLTPSSCTTIPVRIMRAPATTTDKSGLTRSKRKVGQGEEGATQLTVKILRQLGVGIAKLHRLLGCHLELVGDLGELAACPRQVRRGHAQIALQLRHLCLKGRLLMSGSLRGISGGGLGCGRSGLGPLSGLLRRRCGRLKLLNFSLGECKPRRQRVPLSGGYCGNALDGGGSVFADWQADSGHARADVLLTTAPATATGATTSCNSS